LHGLFADTPPTGCGGTDTLWADQAQILFNTSTVDTVSWHLLEAQYTAVGGESYLLLGNFFSNEDSDTTLFWVGSGWPSCQLLIDDVYVGSCDVGIGEQSAGTITSVFPNPVQQGDRVVIRLGASHTDREVRVIDATGRAVVVMQALAGTEHLELPTDELPRGLYLITVGGSHNGARLVVE
jgi:hypothetical protein